MIRVCGRKMMSVAGGGLLVGLLLMGSGAHSVASAAQQAVGLFVTYQGTQGTKGDQGIYLSDMQTQNLKKIYDGPVDFAHISPDGRSIAFNAANKLNIMNNDGTGVQTNLAPCSRGAFSWTTNGIFFVGTDKKIYRYQPSSKTLTSVGPAYADFPRLCATEDATYNYFCSHDGRRAWLRASFDEKVDGKGCDIDYPTRGSHPFIFFNTDFSDYSVVWHNDWGHGDNMSASGEVMFMNKWGDHRPMKTYPISPSGVGEMYYVDPPIPADYKGINAYIPRCANADTIMGFQAMNPDETQNLYVVYSWNHTPTHLYGTLKAPTIAGANLEDDIRFQDIWWGSLPVGDSPFLTLDKSELVFVAPSSGNPAAKTIALVNSNAVHTLGTVTATITPTSANWLSVAFNTQSGNNRTITAAVDVAALPSAMATATVTVSGGSAANTVSFNVTAYKASALAAPSGLRANAAGDSLLDVALRWVDNATNETGYGIFHSTNNQQWAQVGSAAANATAFTHPHVAQGTHYYRVSALGSGGSSSGYSNVVEQLIEGIAWIRVLSPGEGNNVQMGSVGIIRWETNLVDKVVIKLLTDGGFTETILNETGGVSLGSPLWNNFSWKAPNVPEAEAYIQIEKYDPPAIVGVSGAFTISSNPSGVQGVAAYEQARGGVIEQSDRQLTFRPQACQQASLTLCSIDGRVVAQGMSSHALPIRMALDKLAPGVYLMRMVVDNQATVRSLSIVR